MKRLLIVLSLIPACAFGQAASDAERTAVLQIAQCLVQNAPEDWSRLIMMVHLEKAGDETGQVRYISGRTSSEEPVAYVPCDRSQPARILLDARKDLPQEKRGWIGARLVLRRDGNFSLNYDYP